MMRLVLLAALFLAAPAQAADSAADALQLLQRAARAASSLNYSGTFIYQHEGHTEASRITHLYEAGKESERIEVLDGSPREVVRENNELRCYLPESRLLVLDRRNGQHGFPSVLPGGLGDITDTYVIRMGPPARVAGHETHSIVVDPRDALRYGRQFWVETQSGLLLKSGIRGSRGDFTESFTFTEVQIGGNISYAQLRARTSTDSNWRIHDIRATRQDGAGHWVFHEIPPGFKQVSQLYRPSRDGAQESSHVVFTDGLSAISVFIEPLMKGRPLPSQGMFAMGAVNVYRKVADRMQFVVMGDVPPATLRMLGDGVGKGKP